MSFNSDEQDAETAHAEQMQEAAEDAEYGYADLEAAANLLLEKAAFRIAEKEPDHEPGEWRQDGPMYHFDRMDHHVEQARMATEAGNTARVLMHLADAFNHACMAFVNVTTKEDDDAGE